MPRYYFDLHDDLDADDPEGRELPDIRSAIDRALAEAREMICAGLKMGQIDLRHRIDVRDEAGNVLVTVEFEDAVRVVRGGQPV